MVAGVMVAGVMVAGVMVAGVMVAWGHGCRGDGCHFFMYIMNMFFVLLAVLLSLLLLCLRANAIITQGSDYYLFLYMHVFISVCFTRDAIIMRFF